MHGLYSKIQIFEKHEMTSPELKKRKWKEKKQQKDKQKQKRKT